MKSKDIKKIIFTGGGTGGSVTPLLAIFDELKNNENYEFLWIGTRKGVEKKMVMAEGMRFIPVFSGKFRRYFSIYNILDIFSLVVGFCQSIFVLINERPVLIISAGGFVSVPMVWAAWFLRIPTIIHQQDARAGLANKLMAPAARTITVSWEKSLKDYGRKAIWTGNPVRKIFQELKINKNEACQKFGLNTAKPILLVMGGGTGSEKINKILAENSQKLNEFCQILHVTGGRKIFGAKESKNYKIFDFLNYKDMFFAYAAADMAVSRCGMNALTEMSIFGLPAMLIPLPGTHQEDNALIFQNAKAALIYSENELLNIDFVSEIKKTLLNEELKTALSNNIKTIMKKDAREKYSEIVKNII